MSPNPLILYSTNSYLAYHISSDYYKGIHWVYCSPFFDPNVLRGFEICNPPSSCPSKLMKTYLDDARSIEKHSLLIQNNKRGLKNGVESKFKAGVISLEQKGEIMDLINQASNSMFEPLVYIIPFNRVRDRTKEIPLAERANELSKEYLIENLTRSQFDVICLKGVF